MIDSPELAAHLHMLRCAERFYAARDAAHPNSVVVHAAGIELYDAQRAYWAFLDPEED